MKDETSAEISLSRLCEMTLLLAELQSMLDDLGPRFAQHILEVFSSADSSSTDDPTHGASS